MSKPPRNRISSPAEDPPVTWRGVVPGSLAGCRADQIVAELAPQLSRAQAQRLIREGRCTVNGRTAKASDRLAGGERIALTVVAPETSVAPERAPLAILYEDDALIALNKPVGMVVHPARGAPAGTLLNVLVGYLGPGERPSFVHRLDRHTSGAILAAKSVFAHRELKAQLEAWRLQRTYWALAWGDIDPPTGTIQAGLARDRGDKTRMRVAPDGKEAITHYRVLRRHRHDGRTLSLVEVQLETGRTHQIRAHFEWLGHPLVGDRVYRGERPELADIEHSLPGQALHARRIEFDHPTTGERIVVEATLPEAMERLMAEDQC